MKYAGKLLRRAGGGAQGADPRGQSSAGNNPQEDGKDRPDPAVVLALASNYNLLSISRLHWSRLRSEGSKAGTIFTTVWFRREANGDGGFKTHSNVQKPSQHVLETDQCLEYGERKMTWERATEHTAVD